MLSMRSNVAGYAEEAQVFGRVVEVSLVKETITLRDNEDELHVFKADDVIELLPVGTMNGMGVFQHDLFEGATGHQYEIDLNESEEIELYILDDMLNRKIPNSPLKVRSLDDYEGVLTLIGNLLEVKSKMKPLDFQMKVFKEFDDGDIKYMYAGNQQESGEIDLITVSFFGGEMLSDASKYERTTITHKHFLAMLDNGNLTEVSNQELANYITGLMYGIVLDEDGEEIEFEIEEVEEKTTVKLFDFEDEEEEDELESCPQCELELEECGCNIFNT